MAQEGGVMAIAKIENGRVVQVDRTTDTAPEGWLAVSAEVVAGMAYDGETFSVVPPGDNPVPQSVGRVQAKIWLHRAGKLAAVQSYIDASEDAELQLWWNEANEFRRDNAHVNALAGGFDIDLDVAFTEAAEIA
jgi:hypothetical protein